MQPPHLAAIVHGKLSSHVSFKFSWPRPNIKNRSVAARFHLARHFYLFTRLRLRRDFGRLVRISLVQRQRDTNAPPEKFRHRTALLILL
jgi:hypothetical protein